MRRMACRMDVNKGISNDEDARPLLGGVVHEARRSHGGRTALAGTHEHAGARTSTLQLAIHARARASAHARASTHELMGPCLFTSSPL